MLRGAPGCAPHELMARLLLATAQDQPGAIDPARLLSFLGLEFLPVDFATALRDVLPDDASTARALLSSPDSEDGMAASEKQLEYQRGVEERYRRRIEDLLSPLVGPAAVRAGVTADVDFTATES